MRASRDMNRRARAELSGNPAFGGRGVDCFYLKGVRFFVEGQFLNRSMWFGFDQLIRHFYDVLDRPGRRYGRARSRISTSGLAYRRRRDAAEAFAAGSGAKRSSMRRSQIASSWTSIAEHTTTVAISSA
jgi:hypothetical protein